MADLYTEDDRTQEKVESAPGENAKLTKWQIFWLVVFAALFVLLWLPTMIWVMGR